MATEGSNPTTESERKKPVGKCSSCNQVAELSASVSISGRNYCFDFDACNRRRMGIPNGPARVLFRRITNKGKACFKDYFLREIIIGETKEYSGMLGYELVPDIKEGTVFSPKEAWRLAKLYGGKAVEKAK